MDDPSSSSDDAASAPDCPRCGRSVVVLVVTGPQTGSVSPCGCSVPPELLERES
ncbi:hypothetical protein [Natronococcus wangiae]|uniref:hypothetical protein n=1 Tax=Natronococcus wangiae TaxID=3068275 RepID=UPI00273D2A22|nr:hypothetical protein [Natronococcus sp. AD5]